MTNQTQNAVNTPATEIQVGTISINATAVGNGRVVVRVYGNHECAPAKLDDIVAEMPRLSDINIIASDRRDFIANKGASYNGRYYAKANVYIFTNTSYGTADAKKMYKFDTAKEAVRKLARQELDDKIITAEELEILLAADREIERQREAKREAERAELDAERAKYEHDRYYAAKIALDSKSVNDNFRFCIYCAPQQSVQTALAESRDDDNTDVFDLLPTADELNDVDTAETDEVAETDEPETVNLDGITEINNETVKFFDGKFLSVFSHTYHGAIVKTNGIISYCVFNDGDTEVYDVRGHEVSYDEFMQIMAQRAEHLPDEPQPPTDGKPKSDGEIKADPLNALDADETAAVTEPVKTSAKKNFTGNPAETDDEVKFNHVNIYLSDNDRVSIEGYFNCKNITTAYRRFCKITKQAAAKVKELDGFEFFPAEKLTQNEFGWVNENEDLIFANDADNSLAIDVDEDQFYIFGNFNIEPTANNGDKPSPENKEDTSMKNINTATATEVNDDIRKLVEAIAESGREYLETHLPCGVRRDKLAETAAVTEPEAAAEEMSALESEAMDTHEKLDIKIIEGAPKAEIEELAEHIAALDRRYHELHKVKYGHDAEYSPSTAAEIIADAIELLTLVDSDGNEVKPLAAKMFTDTAEVDDTEHFIQADNKPEVTETERKIAAAELKAKYDASDDEDERVEICIEAYRNYIEPRIKQQTRKIAEQVCDSMTAAAPDDWSVAFTENGKFAVYSSDSVNVVDTITAGDFLNPKEFFEQFRRKPTQAELDDPNAAALAELNHEREQLLTVRDELAREYPDEVERLKLLDEMIAETDADITALKTFKKPRDAVEFDDKGNVKAVWF